MKLNNSHSYKEIVVVPKNFCIYNHLSVGKNVALFLKEEMCQQDAEEKSREALNSAGLLDHFDMFPSILSFLEKKKLAILRGIVQSPDLLLIEEPYNALTADQQKEMASFISSLLTCFPNVTVATTEPKIA